MITRAQNSIHKHFFSASENAVQGTRSWGEDGGSVFLSQSTHNCNDKVYEWKNGRLFEEIMWVVARMHKSSTRQPPGWTIFSDLRTRTRMNISLHSADPVGYNAF